MPNAPKTCRAALLKAYREPLTVEEVPMPREIEAGAMLVKNDASSICGSDMHAWRARLRPAWESQWLCRSCLAMR